MDSTGSEDVSASRHDSSYYPLSHGQQALWVVYRTAPESVAYNLSGAVAIPSDTNLAALRRAFQRLAARQPMLRTIFAVPDGEPMQRVLPAVDVDFRCEDASEWRPAQLDERLAAEIYRPFDLARRPAWRVVVLQHAPLVGDQAARECCSEDVLLLVLHHILGDLWSIAILMSEIAALYRDEITGAPAALKPLRASYRDYVAQEAQRLAGPEADSSWNYWRAQLSGDVPPLDVPTDRPRLSLQSGRGAAHVLAIDQELVARLRALAETRHATLYLVLLTAFQVLLHRYTGQDDVLVGFPKAGRSHVFARVVGYFVNPVVMRADFRENPAFADLLLANQHAIADGAPHDWYPFSRLVQQLRPAREFGRSPLFQAMYSWQKTTALLPRDRAGPLVLGQGNDALDLGGLRMRPIAIAHRVAPVDLTMAAAEDRRGLVVTLEYRTDLFEAATIARMAESYRILLESIARDLEQTVSRLPILSEVEQQALVETWNATAMAYPSELCLHQLVERQAAQRPESPAVVAGDARLSYCELNERAEQVAHALRQLGVGPDTPVGLLCARSAEALVGLLAILKAGGAYVPLDPTYPDERLTFMLRDSAAPLLLTQRALSDRLARVGGAGDGSSARVIYLDAIHDGTWADGRLMRAHPRNNRPLVVTPDHLAYLIYTSGSTGQPNGVALAHRGVVSLLSDFQRRGPLVPGAACSWWTSLSFDVAVYEIFSAWLAGATLYVIPEPMRLDAPALLAWLHTHQIASAYLPPFLLADYARWLDAHPGAAALRRLLVGVEPIPEHLLRSIQAQLPALCLINGYGPSETTICSTLYQVTASTSTSTTVHQRTPIGRPVANTQVYLLDRHLQPVPVGVVGEIYIGGVGLARGYWRRPEITAARFLPDPFCAPQGGQLGGQPGGRLYRTGDLARLLPDGNLEYVGRRDSQIKLRGYRIELGEIEAALAQHPNVKQAGVLVQEDTPGDKRLVAYVTPIQDPPPLPGELRRFLAQRLPHALLPSTFVVSTVFPLTPSGKVDWRALTAPESQWHEQQNALREPRTDAERLLVTLWQQALGVEQVGVHDNFFELGGDSLLGIQIIARAAEAGLHLTARHLFDAPTVAGLAALANTSAPAALQPEQGILDGAVPLTPIQRWFFDQELPNPHYWNQALLCLTRQPLDPAVLRSAVATLVEHHDALRLRYTRTPTGWSQAYAAPSKDVPCDVIDLSAVPAAQQIPAIEARAAALQQSLNLSAGPLIRVAYFDLGATRPGRLLMIVHHLAIDGVSWRILLDDLRAAYRQLQKGQPVRLPPKTTSYRAWAQRLADFAQSSEVRDEAGFWLRAAGDELPSVPTDRPSSSSPAAGTMATEAHAQSISVHLGRTATQALVHEALRVYRADVQDLVLTALALAFERWTGSSTLWLDLEGHGREDLFDAVDLSRTVGWFTALYPVRVNLPLDTEPDHMVQAIHEQLRRIPRHGLDYGLLRYLSADPALMKRMRAIPPAPVSFNYLGQVFGATEEDLIAFPAPESSGPLRGPDAPRAHLLEIDAAIIGGDLRMGWTYSPHAHRRDTVQLVASFCIEALRTLVAQPSSPAPTADTRSDGSAPDVHAGFHRARREAWRATEVPDLLSRRADHCAAAGTGDHAERYPLSPMQQGMVFHTLLAPASGVYVEQITGDMQGPLDVHAFESVWQRVLERHTILRSSVVWNRPDRMLQVVHQEIKLPLDLRDWRMLSPAEQHAHFNTLVAAERRRGFDLSSAPLLRLCLLRTADERYRFLLSYHHVLLDGWSVALLFKEIFALYAAITTQVEHALPPVRPYADYIAWLERQEVRAAQAFWHNALTGCATASTLPLRPLGRASSRVARMSQAAELETYLSTQTTAALRSLAQRYHLTLNTLVQGALALLLSQYAQQEEVLFGFTVAGRPPDLTGIERMIGLFINTLPLRVRVEPHAHLVEWLQRLQNQASETRQYEYCSLMQIQAWSGMRQRAPLFETLLVFENYPLDDALLPELTGGVRLHAVRAIEQTNYPLAFVAVPGVELYLKVVYDSARFEPEAIKEMLGYLGHLLERMAVAPDQLLATLLRRLTAPERQVQSAQAERDPARAREETSDSARSPLERYLAHLWQDLLAIEQVGVHADFFELGGNSLLGAALVQRLQAALGEDVALTAIFEMPTIDELASYLQEHHPSGVARALGMAIATSSPSFSTARAQTQAAASARPAALVAIQPHGARPPLFCVHPAGGIVFPYYTLVPYLGKDQPLYGLQDPALYTKRSPRRTIEDMAAHYVEALRTVQPDGPYYLLGWSVGGLVAYEMAQQLMRQGQSIAALIMLDTAAPARREPATPHGPLSRRTQQVGALVHGVQALLRTRSWTTRAMVKPILSYVHSGLFLLTASARHLRVPPRDRKPSTLERLQWAGLDTWRALLLNEAEVAATVSRETSLLLVEMPAVRRTLELVREHRQLAMRYSAAVYRGRITLLRAVPAERDDPPPADSTRGWEQLAADGVEIHTLRANHVALFVKPYVQAVAQELAACIDRNCASVHDAADMDHP